MHKLSSDLHALNSSQHSIAEAKRLKLIDKKLSFYERFKKALERNINIDPGRLLGLTDASLGW
ncbi:hypothetical protein [uncultured Methanobrevibacter sp.]|uniref:hypothetical protein n=1 Tax=uncultured Methanobrevibacter sp. TaxID=253161 RepID=UPI0025D770F3|nr:hypothetical protein [uncultured Methanobrevibacter sp.]